MYSVYLLDDEPCILEGLKYIVPWEEYGFEIIGTAKNGEDGFKDIINKKIDLIVTDIMMPKMTGLELINNLKDQNYDSQYLVLSAFQEFEYAKEAISMGAENYILKPIDTNELVNSLKSVYKKIKEKEKSILDNNIIKNKSLIEVLTDTKYGNIKDTLNEIGINIDIENCCVSILEISDDENDLEKILKYEMKESNILYCIQSKTRAILVLNENSHSNIIDRLTNLKNNILSTLKGNVYISLGKYIDSLEELSLSYQTANKVSEYKIVYPNISWIKEYKEDSFNKSMTSIEFGELKKVLLSKDFASTSILVENIFTTIKEGNISPKHIKINAIEVFLYVYNYFNESKRIKGLNVYLENVINNDTIDEIQSELLNMIRYMQSKLEYTENSISPIILNVLDCIEEHYNKDLNLKQISDNLNINSIYLGQLFQKEIGILFSDYINNFRINKAKELLVNTSLKASEIGELVGYGNKNYFYRKFKDIVGVTPSDWRKINL